MDNKGCKEVYTLASTRNGFVKSWSDEIYTTRDEAQRVCDKKNTTEVLDDEWVVMEYGRPRLSHKLLYS